MKSYKKIGCAIQALLEEGYALSIEVKARTQVPDFPLHWAHGIPVKVGQLNLTNEGAKGFHLKFDGDDEKVLEIIRRYGL